MNVIAEGIESQEQANALNQLGCHLMQGYYYGKPMKINELEDWYQNRCIKLAETNPATH